MENAPDDPGFFLNDLNIFILISALGGNHLPIVAVSVHDLVWNIPLRKAHLLPQPDVTGNAAAFFLCNGCQCRKSLVGSAVSRFSFSNRIVTPQSCRTSSALIKSAVFRANRDMDLHTMRSIFPSLQWRISRRNPVLFSLEVPEMP